MFCPRCGAEFGPGLAVCAECGVALVPEPPPPEPRRPEPPPPEPPSEAEVLETGLVAVFSTRDPGLLAVARTLLDAAGIPFLVRGEEGRPPGIAGFVLPYEILVTGMDADEAEGILRDMDDRGPGGEYHDPWLQG